MVKVKKETVRSDTSEKAQKSRSQIRNERARIYTKYLRSKQFKEVRDIVRARQNNRCPICGEEFTDENPGVCHHRCYVWAGYGGEKEADCCVMIHSWEHQAIHRHRKSFKLYSDDNDRNRPADENLSELAQAIRRKRESSKKKKDDEEVIDDIGYRIDFDVV